MHIKPFKALTPELDLIKSVDTFFSTVKMEFPKYNEAGFFKTEAKEAFYIYKISEGNHSYTGILNSSSVEDYKNGLIKKHEKTISVKEQQQLSLLLHRKAIVKPVLLTYPKVDSIDQFTKNITSEREPIFSIHFDRDKQQHEIWLVDNVEEIQTLEQLFLEHVHCAYIADGHHRTSTSALLHAKNKDIDKYKYFLTAYFPNNELEILAYNRVVEALSSITPTRFLAKLSNFCKISPVSVPEAPKNSREMLMYINYEWYSLKWKDNILKKAPDNVLDVKLFNKYILTKIIGINDVKNDSRIRYVEGKTGLEGIADKANKAPDRIGFCLYPVDMKDFIRISDNKETLPPKSTWFEPRMKNGVIVQTI
ncbi:MAG: DUF1015 family protein [Saprospiraceae bacterium]|nr:DUF1015 family protein [Saprospiraceae bacterium]